MGDLFGNKVDEETLLSWVSSHCTEDEMREVFLNMDIALKYIHEHGYCVDNFYPTCIHVLDNKPDHIQFDNLLELSDDPNERKQMIRQDIFNSSFIQIGLYTNTLKNLRPDFLKENFDAIAKFVPEGDVPYYRGVVQRGATVYFSEYAVERMNKDLDQLKKELNEVSSDSTDEEYVPNSLSNDEINNKIYKNISGMREAAFINVLIIPGIALISMIILGIISWIILLK